MIRNETSEKNEYHLEKNRYLELKNFCLQYDWWKKQLAYYDNLLKAYTPWDCIEMKQCGEHSDPVVQKVIQRERYLTWINMVEKVACELETAGYNYVLLGVTQGVSYDILAARYNIPYSRNYYYDLQRKFYWLLDKERG